MERTLAEIKTQLVALNASLDRYAKLAAEHEAAGSRRIAAKLREVIEDIKRDIGALTLVIGGAARSSAQPPSPQAGLVVSSSSVS
jgi:hypothetical protein